MNSRSLRAVVVAVLSVAFAAVITARQGGTPTLYASPDLYHLANCAFNSQGDLRMISVDDAYKRGLKECSLCRPRTFKVIDDRFRVNEFDMISFMSPVAGNVMAKPIDTSEVVAEFEANRVYAIDDARPGWARIDVVGQSRGWVQATQDSIIPRHWLFAQLLISEMTRKKWPTSVHVDILQKRVKVGFTQDQVVAALGKPLTTTTEETAAGTTTIFVYPNQAVTLTGDKVSRIVTAKK